MNISNQAFTKGLLKSKADSNVASKLERTLYTSQFQRRGHYRKIID